MADYEQEPLRVRDNRRSYGFVVMIIAGILVLALFWPRIMPRRVVDTSVAMNESRGASPERFAAAVVSMDALADTEPDSPYVGNRVMVDEAPILGKLGPRTFWVGKSWEERSLVSVKPGVTYDTDADKGDRVDLVGMVQRIPLDDDWLKMRGIPKHAVLELKERAVYLDAEAVEIDNDGEERYADLSDLDDEVGKVVYLNDVQVQNLQVTRGFVAVEDDKDKVYVALPAGSGERMSRMQIKNGDIVDIIGVVKKRVASGKEQVYVEAQTLDEETASRQ
jgi:hypothetical protein